jgi:hypothetical protein
MRGYETALREHHIPFDIISGRKLNREGLARYKAVILTNYACMREEEAEAVRDYVKSGGSVIATFETSLYDWEGKRRPGFLLGDLFGVNFESVSHVNGEDPGAKQNYLHIAGESPVLDGIREAGLIPIAGEYCVTGLTAGQAPLLMGRPFIVFPEGLSYCAEAEARTGRPGVVLREHGGGSGRTAYFSGQLDKMNCVVGFEEISKLLANAALWALGGKPAAGCDGPDSVVLSLRLQDKRANAHLVNMTGGRRMLRQAAPVYNITVSLRKDIRNVKRAYSLSSREELLLSEKDGAYTAVLPELKDYEVIVFEE